MRLVEADTGRVLLADVAVADRFGSRLAGLQFRRPLPPGVGLLLVPCTSVHTCFVRSPLDLLMLDREMRVVEVRRGVRPWRVVWPARGTHSVAEMTAGNCPAIDVGARVCLVP